MPALGVSTTSYLQKSEEKQRSRENKTLTAIVVDVARLSNGGCNVAAEYLYERIEYIEDIRSHAQRPSLGQSDRSHQGHHSEAIGPGQENVGKHMHAQNERAWRGISDGRSGSF